MTPSNSIEERVMQLPSDQDSTGRTLGIEEIQALTEAINTGTLTSTKGRFVKTFETEFARLLGVKHAFACASGTAAVHLAVAAINPNPGDEIITTPITDMALCDAEPRLQKHASPRQVAGGSLSEDILKCRLKPINTAEYLPASFTAEQLNRLYATSPDGVCEWSKPGIGQQPARSPLARILPLPPTRSV